MIKNHKVIELIKKQKIWKSPGVERWWGKGSKGELTNQEFRDPSYKKKKQNEGN